MTDRLYYTDPYLVAFSAAVSGKDGGGTRILLDRSAFYPASGGQPHDLGTIAGVPVIEIVDENGAVIHVTETPLPAAVGESVKCEIDWARRFDHMQQHTGQHLLSAVFVELWGIETLSFHMGAEVSTIELAASVIEVEKLRAAQQRANQIIAANRRVAIEFEDAAEAAGLRKASSRSGTLRIISIDDLDRSACGGTHVRSTGEIGAILLRGTEKIRGNTRLEFVCGLRAVGRARQDYEALSAVAGGLGCPIDEAAGLAAAQRSRMAEAEKSARSLTLELAKMRGRELYSRTSALVSGFRFHERAGDEISEEVRAEAQAYVEGTRAVFLVWSAGKRSLLLAVSADSGLHAGNILKPLLAQAGGRGGGSGQVAQGSVPSTEALQTMLHQLRNQL